MIACPKAWWWWCMRKSCKINWHFFFLFTTIQGEKNPFKKNCQEGAGIVKTSRYKFFKNYHQSMPKKKEKVMLNGYLLASSSLPKRNKYIRNSQKYVWVERFWLVFKFLILFLFVADPAWEVPCLHNEGRTWP